MTSAARRHASSAAEATPDLDRLASSPELARCLVDLAGITPSLARRLSVLEPSAGQGAIVRVLQERGAYVTCGERRTVDRDWLLRRVLFRGNRILLHEDFLQICIPGAQDAYDRVVMVPPLGPGDRGEGDYIDHVRHAYLMLRPRGILVAAVPGASSFPSQREIDFRQWCWERRPAGAGATSLPLRALRDPYGESVDVPIVAVRLEARTQS